jgi:hypothetical protein
MICAPQSRLTGPLGIAVILSFFLLSISSALNEDVIEDVNKQGLEKLIDQHDFVAVLFCKSNFKSTIPAIHRLID